MPPTELRRIFEFSCWILKFTCFDSQRRDHRYKMACANYLDVSVGMFDLSALWWQCIESYWMHKHCKRCVCVCLCMHRYAKHRSSNSGPLNPLVKDCPNLSLCESYESCHQNSHLMSDMPWLCEINRSHCPVMMSSVSLIAVCRFGAQAKRKSLKWCSAASALERQVGKAAAWAILLADQSLTYSTRVVVVDGHGFFISKQF